MRKTSKQDTVQDLLNGDCEFQLLIIGESHICIDHGMEQARLIRTYKPEYVLYEGCNEENPGETEGYLSKYKYANLESLLHDNEGPIFSRSELLTQIQEGIGNYLSEVTSMIQRDGCSLEKAKSMAHELLSEGGIVPSDEDQLFKTPFYETSPRVIDALKSYFEEVAEKFEDGYDVLYKRRARWLQLFKTQRLNPAAKKEHYLFHAIYDVGAKLVGCDIKKRVLTGVEDESEEGIKEYKKRVKHWIAAHNVQREVMMGLRMLEFLQTTDKKIIAIVGKKHVREDSSIFPILHEWKIPYKVVHQDSSRERAVDDWIYGL